jgi:hypothetical protein
MTPWNACSVRWPISSSAPSTTTLRFSLSSESARAHERS